MSEIINKPIGIRCADIYLRFPEIMEDECNDLAEFLEDEHIVYEGATDIFIDQKDKLNKYKEVLDKIKEYCNNRLQYYNEMRRDYDKYEFDGYAENDNENILELLEEIE